MNYYNCTFSKSNQFAQCLTNSMAYVFFVQLQVPITHSMFAFYIFFMLTKCKFHAYSTFSHTMKSAQLASMMQHHIHQSDFPLRHSSFLHLCPMDVDINDNLIPTQNRSIDKPSSHKFLLKPYRRKKQQWDIFKNKKNETR